MEEASRLGLLASPLFDDVADVLVLEDTPQLLVVDVLLFANNQSEIDGGFRLHHVNPVRREPKWFRRLCFKGQELGIQSECELRVGRGGDCQPVRSNLTLRLYAVMCVLGTCLACGDRPKALVCGVGGGSIVSLLEEQGRFDVRGVEISLEVVRVAATWFGLNPGLIDVDDAHSFLLHKYSRRDLDCLIMDIDDTMEAFPPPGFLEVGFLKRVRDYCLHPTRGTLVINFGCEESDDVRRNEVLRGFVEVFNGQVFQTSFAPLDSMNTVLCAFNFAPTPLDIARINACAALRDAQLVVTRVEACI